MGDKPSGAANRAAAKVRAEEARRQEAERRSLGPVEVPAHLKHFERAGVPPIGDPVGGVKWANDIAMLLLQDVLLDPVFNAEQRLRYASDLIGKIGMLHAKAHVQQRLAEISKTDDVEQDEDLEPNPLAGANTPRDRGDEEG